MLHISGINNDEAGAKEELQLVACDFSQINVFSSTRPKSWCEKGGLETVGIDSRCYGSVVNMKGRELDICTNAKHVLFLGECF